jgi:fatty-acyl-CoA synthase
VLGMPDPTWGEVSVAVCVLHEGSHTTADQIRSWLTERMTPYKVPRHVVFWEPLPRSGYGKIVRRTIRDLLSQSGRDSRERGDAQPGSQEDARR